MINLIVIAIFAFFILISSYCLYKLYKMDFESFKPKSFFELFNEQLLKYIYSEKALHKRIGLGIASENMKPKDMYCFHVVIQLKSFIIFFCHQIRGDLIYVFDKINIESHNTIIDYSYENENLAKISYVDQSNSYSFLGTKNEVIKYSDDKIIDLYHELTKYIKGEL